MPTKTPEAIAAEVLRCQNLALPSPGAQSNACASDRLGSCEMCQHRPAVADAIRREREAMPTDEAGELLEARDLLNRLVRADTDLIQSEDAWKVGHSTWESGRLAHERLSQSRQEKRFALARARAYLARTAPEANDPPPRSSAQGAREVVETIWKLYRQVNGYGDDWEAAIEHGAAAIDAYAYASASALAAERVREALEKAERAAVIHSQYPVVTEYDSGYDAGRKAASAAIRALIPKETR